MQIFKQVGVRSNNLVFRKLWSINGPLSPPLRIQSIDQRAASMFVSDMIGIIKIGHPCLLATCRSMLGQIGTVSLRWVLPLCHLGTRLIDTGPTYQGSSRVIIQLVSTILLWTEHTNCVFDKLWQLFNKEMESGKVWKCKRFSIGCNSMMLPSEIEMSIKMKRRRSRSAYLTNIILFSYS